MRLVDNWRVVLQRALSIRLLILGGLLSGLEVALPLIGGVMPIPPGLFAGLSLLVTAAAFVARLVAQKSVSGE